MLGAVTFDARGARWTLFLGNAAQCAIEEQYDKGYFAVISEAIPLENVTPEMLEDPAAMIGLARKLRVSTMRDLAWHGLQRFHPGTSLDEVSDLIDDMGQAAFGDLIGKAIASTQDRGGDGAAAPGKPRKRSTPRSAPTGRR